jgi:hypothetical protein
VPIYQLGCHRTRKSLGERRSPAGCAEQSVPGVCSPAATKLRMFARWPHLHRPDPCLARGRTSWEDCRAEGSLPTPWRLAVLSPYPPRPAWSYALSGSVLQPRTLSQLDSDGTVYRHDAVHRVSVGRGYGRPEVYRSSAWDGADTIMDSDRTNQPDHQAAWSTRKMTRMSGPGQCLAGARQPTARTHGGQGCVPAASTSVTPARRRQSSDTRRQSKAAYHSSERDGTDASTDSARAGKLDQQAGATHLQATLDRL